jgi:hypothetical protein
MDTREVRLIRMTDINRVEPLHGKWLEITRVFQLRFGDHMTVFDCLKFANEFRSLWRRRCAGCWDRSLTRSGSSSTERKSLGPANDVTERLPRRGYTLRNRLSCFVVTTGARLPPTRINWTLYQTVAPKAPKKVAQNTNKGLYLFRLLHVSTDMDYARHHERAFFRL